MSDVARYVLYCERSRAYDCALQKVPCSCTCLPVEHRLYGVAFRFAGKNLQAQYERWQPRAKYKMHLDPTLEDVKKLCVSCRRTAKVRAADVNSVKRGCMLPRYCYCRYLCLRKVVLVEKGNSLL